MVELHLRSIMCVPLKVKECVVGVFYLDNSSESRMFLKSDLYLFELYALDSQVPVMGAPTVSALMRASHGHVLGKASLLGTYTTPR